jgi:hypothetical protein
MAVAMALVLWGLTDLADGLLQKLVTVVVPGGLGLLVYGGLVAVLRVEEVGLLREVIGRRWPGRPRP